MNSYLDTYVGKDKASFAVVVYDDDDRLVHQQVLPIIKQSPNRVALLAIRYLLLGAEQSQSLIIYTSNRYVISNLVKKSDAWAEPKSNSDLLLPLYELLDKRQNVQIVYDKESPHMKQAQEHARSIYGISMG